MTALGVERGPAPAQDDEISLLALGSVLLSWRRTLLTLVLLGAAIGLAFGLLSTRTYMSTATFIPQAPEVNSSSGLALAASQLGIKVPGGNGAWGPPMYVEMIHSRTLLKPIALDTVVVAEEGGRRLPLMDLLKIEASTPARRTELTIGALTSIVGAREDKQLGAVVMTVTTPWPSVSFALAKRLLQRVNDFNLETRKSQAAAERKFVEGQAVDAERALREAEDGLQFFLQRNRAIMGSPELGFERDRLQRDVMQRQQLYTSWLQSREEARIREVRDTPVITVLEEPELPLVGVARKSVQKAAIAGLGAGILGVLIAVLAHALGGARRAESREAREFFQLLDDATPRFLKRKMT